MEIEPKSDVDVWRIDLVADPTGSAASILSAAERRRAAAFRFGEHRRRFVVAHVALRRILGVYLDADPAEIEMQQDERAKPRLAASGVDLRFNLSHSVDLALVAVTVGPGRGCEIGVDVEWRNPQVEIGRLARRFFAAEERARLEALPQVERSREFYRVWTLKEAYLKAVGVGLGAPLDSFTVSPAEVRPPRLLRTEHGDPAAWSLRTLELDEGYAAAVAVEGGFRHEPRLRDASEILAEAADEPDVLEA